MKLFLIFMYFVLAVFPGHAFQGAAKIPDTSEVIKLNKQAYNNRMVNAEQTIADAGKALELARKINYINGVGEAYRVMGIGRYYLDQSEKAINNYLSALSYFTSVNNLKGEAKVYNNMGILFRDHDYDRSLNYLNKSLVIAKKLSDNQLIASLYLNIGNVYYRKKSFYQALNFYDKSNALFITLKDSTNLIVCLQNRGVIYFNLNQFDIAEKLLQEARRASIESDLNESVASIDLTLASLYIVQSKFDAAEKTVNEGVAYATQVKDIKMQYDYKHTTYELEFKRKNYEQALYYLREIYKQDSAIYKSNVSTQMNLIEVTRSKEEQRIENERIVERQQYDRVKFWGVVIVAGLLSVLVALLINNVKRKAKTNEQLTNLNAEVSRQKDNLDRINHHLEEIIDERTKDLQVKNKKLSEYSSYLSHQIRGPIATLKGLMNLEKEGLVDEQECIEMMNKCVGEIDDKIIEMSDMLHDPMKTGL
ncbi:MAG: tetratricopeptide repeat protein [Mucilaginibacter sp.]